MKTKREMEFYINVDFMVIGVWLMEWEEVCPGSCPMLDFAMSRVEPFLSFRATGQLFACV